MLSVAVGGKSAVLSSDTFLKGQELSAVRKARALATRCGIVKIKDVRIKLDNRAGGVSRYCVYVSGDYVEPFSYPWDICYSLGWEIKQYGIAPGHDDGIWGQFLGISGESDFVMEQLWAAEVWGESDNPKPGFKLRVQAVAL